MFRSVILFFYTFIQLAVQKELITSWLEYYVPSTLEFFLRILTNVHKRSGPSSLQELDTRGYGVPVTFKFLFRSFRLSQILPYCFSVCNFTLSSR